MARTSPGWSPEEIEDLRRNGYDDEAISEIVQADAIQPYPLWPDNDLAVMLALDCHWERAIGGFGGQIWQGVRNTEVESTMRTLRVPANDRPVTLRQVRRFINAACAEMNKVEAQRAEENRS